MRAPWSIPESWQWSTMGEVAEVVGGGTPKTDHAEYYGGDIPWITPADLSGYTEKLISRGARSITQAGLEKSGARLMPTGTVLFSSRAPIGYVAVATNPVSTNQGFKSFVLRDGLTPDYVYYYLQHAKKLAVELASGTTFLEISGKKAGQIPIPIPPLDEQRRIVAEIEKQFTRLEAGVAGLRRVQANLKRYRAAVLKTACEGKLVPTEADLARESGHAYETGADLLARILTERRQKWTGRGKYKEPAAPNATNLAPLPEEWTWATVEQLAEVALGKMLDKTKHRTGHQLSYLRNINVRWGKVDTDDLFEMFFEDGQVERYGLREGDVLVCEGGEPGRASVWDGRVTGMMYQKALHRVRFFGSFHARFLVFLLECLSKTGRLERSFTGSTIKHFTRESFVSLPIPLPPFAEQQRIVAEVERRLSVIEELEAVVSANLQRATRLRQAILQRAFEGELARTEQDETWISPDDLPIAAESPSTYNSRANKHGSRKT